MSSFMLTLRHRETIADHTMAFYFGKPAHFQFIAGQALNLTLVTPPQTDAEGDTRTFTIASAPEDDEIVIATRLRDTAFKRVLASVPIGTHVQAEGPDGSFTLRPDASAPAVFLTGGIGITPFRSIIRDAVARQLATRSGSSTRTTGRRTQRSLTNSKDWRTGHLRCISYRP